ncbi:MAG: ornithine--oxo-acid transaminase [bacterium]
MLKSTQEYIALEDKYGAHNYHPLDIVISRAEGVWVYDVEGNRYLDCLSAYSAVNQGHCHPKILAAFQEQAAKVTLTSRAFRNDKLPLFCEKLAKLANMEMVLPMNSGAEAVETAIKAARKWGYTKKGISDNQAEIIVCENNFHGRTTTVVGFSSEEQYREGFGPFTPGFKIIPFGNPEALEAAITADTCAFLVEPIQGEAGILIPPEGYLKRVQEICQRHNVLLIVDEIQCGLGRVGRLFAFQYEEVRPHMIIVGKALSGGFMPVSAVLANQEVLGVFSPGDHGSTFGGNPLGCAVALAALDVIIDEKLIENAATLGTAFLARLKTIQNPHILDVRGKGLFIGVELDTKARPYCEALKDVGLLCKETHENVIRFAPPLVITEEELDWAFERIKKVLAGF